MEKTYIEKMTDKQIRTFIAKNFDNDKYRWGWIVNYNKGYPNILVRIYPRKFVGIYAIETFRLTNFGVTDVEFEKFDEGLNNSWIEYLKELFGSEYHSIAWQSRDY